MIKHGIPNEWTSTLADELSIQSVEDLKSMEMDSVDRVPIEFNQRIYDLRNCYVPDDWTLWYISA
jgi:hypothetical protein